MIITKTPYRLSFFGGGTDYNGWFEEKGALLVGCTFSKYCYISVRRLPPFFEHKSRIVYGKMENVRDNAEIQHRGVRGCLEYLGIKDGLEIHHDGDLPARSGLGTSSSFTTGLLLALHALKNEMRTKLELAREAIHLEQDVLRENVGVQDQILTSYGGLKVLELGPGRDFRVNPLILPKDFQDELERHVMLGFTGLVRNASQVAAAQVKNIMDGRANPQLDEIKGIAEEGLRLFMKSRDLTRIGSLIDLTWKVKRTLSPNVTSDSIDELYKKAISAGAYGGRLLGAGGGGFIFFLAPPERHSAIRAALGSAIKVWVPFEFEHHGAEILLHTQDQNEGVPRNSIVGPRPSENSLGSPFSSFDLPSGIARPD